ncbi:hypothetical protein EGW08_011562 [Elysia chlorotica]|uniref:VWFD domain-containing protein n=1 Tax=Elysia chlorotica TaxID=188477 RepID=A0A433TGD5_ELYCH|nr:hypothetical protein EGW08_011562 [Elysia chlorotica]
MRMYVRVSTLVKEWTLFVEDYPVDETFRILISWSKQAGLSLSIDDKKVKEQMNYVTRTRRNVKGSTSLILGRGSATDSFSNIVLELPTFNAVYCNDDTASSLDLLLVVPELDEEPVVELAIDNNSTEMPFNLSCTFEAIQPQGQETYEYTVSWFVNDRTVLSDPIGNKTSSIIMEAQLGSLQYGDTIHCAVFGCITGNCQTTRGPTKLSNKLEAEIKVMEDELAIFEGDDRLSVTIIATFPPRVFCPVASNTTSREECLFTVSYFFSGKGNNLQCVDGVPVPQTLIIVEQASSKDSSLYCSAVLTELNWRSGVKVWLLATPDGRTDGDHITSLELSASLVLQGTTRWMFSVGTVRVKVVDRDISGVCQIIGDPHITPYPGGKYKYNNYLEGEFVAVTNAEADYDVHVFLRRCRGGIASCVCAVAVRVHDDVILVNRCSQETEDDTVQPVTVHAFLNGALTDDLRIGRMEDDIIRIYLPVGTRVDVLPGRRYLNVVVRATEMDNGKVDGLCGPFDDVDGMSIDVSNENAYNELWRIEDTESSIYSGVCQSSAVSVNTTERAADTMWCNCQKGGLTCANTINNFSCSGVGVNLKRGKDITQQVIDSTTTQNPPNKCFLSQGEVDFEYNKNYTDQPGSWPTPSGITKNEAISECRKTIESSASFGVCRDLLDRDDVVEIIDFCAEDVLLSDSFNFTLSAKMTVQHRCQTIIELTVNLYSNANDTDDQLLDVLFCPSNCSGNGRCLDDKCVCNQGYIGDDCAYRNDTPPVVIRPTDAVCDVRISPCISVTVIGEGFIDSPSLVCFVKEIVNASLEVSVNSSYVQVSATFVSSQQVLCSIPDRRASFNIVVSNVQTISVISASITFITFDSVCYDCTVNGCDLKADVCLVGDECFGPGFANLIEDAPEICTNGTLVPIDRDQIIREYYFFLNISYNLNIVVSYQYNFTIYGSPQLVELPPDLERGALQLNGIDQWLDMTALDPSNCLLNPSNCAQGFSIAFYVKMLDLEEGAYIFTNGGDKPDSCGIALQHLGQGYLRLTFSTSTQEWTLTTRGDQALSQSVTAFVEISWSRQFGLSLYLDQQLAANTTKFYKRQTEAPACNEHDFLVGRDLTGTIYTNMIISGFKVVFVSMEIDNAVPELTTTEQPTVFTTEMQMNTTANFTTEATTMTTETSTSETTNFTETSTQTSVSTDASTQISTESSTEAPTNASTTETSTESSTEAPTNVSTTETSTESSTEAPTNVSTTETSTESSTEAPTNVSTTETSTESSTEASTNVSTTETSTESPTTASTAETSTEALTTASTESPTTASTAETSTESPTTVSTAETSTESPTTASTAETSTEAPTTASTAETSTEAPTTVSTESSTAGTTSDCIQPEGQAPQMTGNPNVNIIPSGDVVNFDCTIRPAENEPGSPQYTVQWLTGSNLNVSLRESVLTGQSVTDRLSVASLRQEEKSAIVNTGLRCSVVASNPQRCGSASSQAATSTIGGFTATVSRPSGLTINEGASTDITVTFSSDISSRVYCLILYGQVCTSISVEAQTAQNKVNQCPDGTLVPSLVFKSVRSSDQCSKVLSSSSDTVTLQMKAVSDGLISPDRPVDVAIVQVDELFNRTTAQRSLDSFVVTVINMDQKPRPLCKVYGDPHVVTFDNSLYDVMTTGEYVLYQHKSMEIQVNGFFYQTGQGSSACGFGVRVGNDVIKISKCMVRQKDVFPVTVTLYAQGGLSPRTSVYRNEDGSTYTVYLPTGGIVTFVSDVEAIMNMFFTPTAVDLSSTLGLCGDFNYSTTGDLVTKGGVVTVLANEFGDEPLQFSNSWRLKRNESIYNGYQGSSDISTTSYCACDDSSLCSDFGDAPLCGQRSGVDITNILLRDFELEQEISSQTQGRRRRRQTAGDDSFLFDPPVTDSQSPTFPTPTGKTETDARVHCYDKLQALTYFDDCSTVIVSTVEINAEVENCVEDILRTDSYSYSSALVQSFQETCQQRAASDPDPDNAAVANIICPADCNGRGTCSNSVCICNDMYTGSDCSILKTSLPVLEVSTSSIICATDQGSTCNDTRVRGDFFIDGAKCHLTPIEVTNSGPTAQGAEVVVDAEYRTRFFVACPIPQERSYSIRISNNGTTKSVAEAYYRLTIPSVLPVVWASTAPTLPAHNSLTRATLMECATMMGQLTLQTVGCVMHHNHKHSGPLDLLQVLAAPQLVTIQMQKSSML